MTRKLFKTSIIVFLIGLLFVENIRGGKKDKDDDDYEESEECYPGRNCLPRCYCAGSVCRPYEHPKTPHHETFICRPFKYPKWKVWKKGSHDVSSNSSITIVTAHHSDISEPLTTVLTNNNFTAYELMKDETGGTTVIPIFDFDNSTVSNTPTSTPAFLAMKHSQN